ncbi:MAG: hypothetical protein QOJ35_2564 [Solirubrobacteraceae bacterium]|jgi:hypothetical protein|nr:hypothetical protein [Solirubrobacteraceae bacterium]
MKPFHAHRTVAMIGVAAVCAVGIAAPAASATTSASSSTARNGVAQKRAAGNRAAKTRADDGYSRYQLYGRAKHIIGHANTLSGEPSAWFRTVRNDESIRGLRIVFETTILGAEGCTAFTDSRGIAECNSGSVFNPLFIFDALVGGYNAVFDGDYYYEPVTVHGTVSPGF